MPRTCSRRREPRAPREGRGERPGPASAPTLRAGRVRALKTTTAEPSSPSRTCSVSSVGVGARRQGEKAAREAINYLRTSGVLEDTGEVKKPRQRPNRVAARQKFGRTEKVFNGVGDFELGGEEGGEVHNAVVDFGSGLGGRDAQPSPSRSYWWRVFRVVPLSRVLRAYGAMQGAYAYISELPQRLASLSAWAERQGLISRRRGRRGARLGSVQYVFARSGPP